LFDEIKPLLVVWRILLFLTRAISSGLVHDLDKKYDIVLTYSSVPDL